MVGLLVGAAVLPVLAPGFLWGFYRFTYVESRNAMVKGTISNVGAQIDGVVTNVEVDAGQRVRAGQVLARFEDRQLQANAQRALSRFERATRELEVERLAIAQERRRLAGQVTEASARNDAARAKTEAARTGMEDAGARYELSKTLADGGMIAPEELRRADMARRTADALAATARADQEAASAARQLAEIESDGLFVRRKHLVVLEADVEASRAELALANADLKATLIRAPGDGWVVRRIAEAGASVVVGQPIVALWIGSEVWVEAWIEERDLGKVIPGGRARVTVTPYPNHVFNGTIESVGVSTDSELPDTAVPQPRNARMRATPVVGVRVKLDESQGLFPGLSAVVLLQKKPS